MNQIKEGLFNVGTWGFTIGTFATNYLTIPNLQGTILFFLSAYFLVLQIRLHKIRIKKEKEKK